MALSFVRVLVKILSVNGFETGLGNCEAQQPSASRNDGSRCFGPDILLREE
jgi:hypothetical protein